MVRPYREAEECELLAAAAAAVLTLCNSLDMDLRRAEVGGFFSGGIW